MLDEIVYSNPDFAMASLKADVMAESENTTRRFQEFVFSEIVRVDKNSYRFFHDDEDSLDVPVIVSLDDDNAMQIAAACSNLAMAVLALFYHTDSFRYTPLHFLSLEDGVSAKTIGRVYKALDDQRSPLYLPVWDTCATDVSSLCAPEYIAGDLDKEAHVHVFTYISVYIAMYELKKRGATYQSVFLFEGNDRALVLSYQFFRKTLQLYSHLGGLQPPRHREHAKTSSSLSNTASSREETYVY